ncbi:hypothetical protein AO9_02740 [Chlamydia psittaci Mat116]|uniref:Uncharacterized protein n=1 Tax=Chlamydia psittaci 99DC5 TaxID=1112251 RepID=A0ABN0MP35_CHLPS|nr:hypothetical protein [Chlamydia psittaci]AGE75108.1 hypothetical protein AO9_02740 [Chlamydia psittaci Mat116]EPJ27606.1 hypothetical protein CP99DC5_0981 [Chlamydia psittaci 99DC5]
MDDKDKTISRFTSDNPNKQTRETDYDATGVKDQNLYLENATLNIQGNLDIEDNFDADTLTVTNDVNANCDFFAGSKLSGSNGFSLRDTVLNGDININSSQSPSIGNISDPLSQRDALTFNYYRKSSVQAYTCRLDHHGIYDIPAHSVIDLQTGTSKDIENYTLMYRNYFYVEGKDLVIKAPGIYQVTFEITRTGGQHSGNDEVNLFLRLDQGSQFQNLCTADTRGHYPTDRTCTALYAIFSISDTSSQPIVRVYTHAHIRSMFSTISVIWFPFASRFPEED